MKLRMDFVTNSSSSSYIIAHKENLFDEDFLKSNELAVLINNLKDTILGYEGKYRDIERDYFDNVEELKEYIIDQYSNSWFMNNDFVGKDVDIEKLIEKDEFDKWLYNNVKELIEQGYSVQLNEVPYNDKEYIDFLVGISNVSKNLKVILQFND